VLGPARFGSFGGREGAFPEFVFFLLFSVVSVVFCSVSYCILVCGTLQSHNILRRCLTISASFEFSITVGVVLLSASSELF